MTKISIIIPTRNRYEYVSLLLQDLRSQDVSYFEVIVIDQSDVKKSLSHCTHVYTDTLGPCASRNIGVEKSSGDILVFLDDDARIQTDFIRQITEPIIADDFDAVAGAICDTEGNYLLDDGEFFTKNSTNFIKIITNNPNSERSRITLSFPAGCSAIKTNVFHQVGGFDESFDPTGAGEDREMAIKLFKYGFSTWYNANAKLLHAIAPIGGSRDMGSRSFMLDVHTHRICRKHFSEALASALKQTLIVKYRTSFIKSLLTGRLVRTKYRLYQEIKKQLAKID